MVCEYLEYLISVQTLLSFDYTGSALKNTGKEFFVRLVFCKKQCVLFKK